MKSIIVVLILVGVKLHSTQSLQNQIPLFVISMNEIRGCLQQERDSTLQTIRKSVLATLIPQQKVECGTGLWTRVAYLNMSDPMQRCPPAWRDRSANGVGVCGRPDGSIIECHGTFYHAGGHSYTRVCGQVIGYQFGYPDGFGRRSNYTINQPYVDGVSITHGNPQSHIWTLAAHGSESNNGCPCEGGPNAPAFVGSKYYCESGYDGTGDPSSVLYTDDLLWDGEQCESEGSCCSTAPWFTVDLANSTNESIEVRICSDSYDTEEDTPIQLLELYIQ